MSFDGLSNMHVLIVEDEADFILELQRILLAFPSPINIKVAKSRDSALALIDSEFFDLIILDLKIPTIDGALDAVPAYGNAVFSKARENAPGTPIFVLTGSSAEDFIPGLLAQQQRENIWGDGREFGTVDFLKKYSFDEFPKKLNPITSAIQSLSEVELDRETLNLSIQEDRLIRIFARRFCGVRCVISPLKTGLSGATVVRLKLTDSSGASVIYAVAKLGSLGEIEDESLRYRSHVVRLDPVATPRNLATLKFGAKASAGIFYSLAGGEDTAFDIVTRPEAFCTAAIRSLASGTGRWFDGVPETRLPIKDIRQRIQSDSALDRILTEFNIPWVHDFETRQIQTRWCCIHGDLHGCNVLVTANGSSILID